MGPYSTSTMPSQSTGQAMGQHDESTMPPTSTDPKGTVIGIAFRYPGASNIKELAAVVDSVKRKETARKTRISQFGTMDTDFFKISPKEAYQSSPILGTLLEVVTECVLDSGMRLNDVTSRETGMYVQSNVPDSYTELTCNAAHYFNFKGPVLDFGGLDASPTNVVRTALLDLMAGRSDLAVVVGIHAHGPSQRHTDDHTGTGGHCRQSCLPEVVVAMLIMSPHLKSKVQSRLHCDILQSTSSDMFIPRRLSVPSMVIARWEQHQNKGEQERNIWKLPCSDIAQEMFRGADSISALMGIVVARYSDQIPIKAKGSIESNLAEQDGKGEDKLINVAVVPGNVITQKHETILRIPKADSITENKEVNKAVLIPTAVHPLLDVSKAEESLNMYQDHAGFVSFLVNSDLCKGLNGQLQQFRYYFKISEASHVSKKEYTIHGEIPVTVAFEDFLLSPWKPSSDFLNLPVIRRSLSAFDEVLRDETDTDSLVSVADLINSSDIPETTERWGIVTRVACQIAVVDLLRAVNSMDCVVSVKGSGLGAVAASYADGALTKVQTVKIAVVLEDVLLQAAESQGDKLMLDVYCARDDVYQLGPWVQVLCPVPRAGFRIAATWDKRDRLIPHIAGKGFAFKELPTRIPVFSPGFIKCINGLDKNLRSIMPGRALWSTKLNILGHTERKTKLGECDSSFFIDLLCTPFEGGPSMQHNACLVQKDKPEVPLMECFSPTREISGQMRETSTSAASSVEPFEILEPDADSHINLTLDTSARKPFETIETGSGPQAGISPSKPHTKPLESLEPESGPKIPKTAAKEPFEILEPIPRQQVDTSPETPGQEPFEMLQPDSGSEIDVITPVNTASKVGSNMVCVMDDVLQELEHHTLENVPTPKYTFLTPFREAESINCSTTGIKGSFLCSFPSESASSSSEFQSADLSGYLKSQTSQSPPTTPKRQTVLVERRLSEESESKKPVDNSVLQLCFFSADDDQWSTSGDEVEDSSVQTVVSSDSSLYKDDIQIHIKPNHNSLLQSLAWIHGSGNRMDAENQVCDDTPSSSSHYTGDFGIHNLWRWNRQPCYQVHPSQTSKIDSKESMKIYSLSPKPRLNETLLYNLIMNRTLEDESERSSALDSSEIKPTTICSFDSSLLMLSGYKWNSFASIILPLQSHDELMDDKKMPKQVRFSYRRKSFLGGNSSDDDADQEVQALSIMKNENKPQLANDLQFGFADHGDLLEVLNLMRNEEFNFISLLQIDESLERYLMDMLYTFPLTSALHVFFTPKLRATSTSKYVITITRMISTFEAEVVVVLRDRSTDQTETCSSIANALSIISSFEEGIYEKYLARVFELPMCFDDGSFSVGRLEFLIFDMEMKVSREVYSDDDKKTEECPSSASSGSYNLDDLIERFGNQTNRNKTEFRSSSEEQSSKSVSDQEEPSRERNSSPNAMTNFYLNFESASVDAFIKLSKINEHILACVKPKPLCTITEEELNKLQRDGDFPDEVDESRTPPGLMYLISVKSDPESQVFLYCKNPQEISRWDSIHDVVEELKWRHPNLSISHETFISRCDEKVVPFEVLLHAFMRDDLNNDENLKQRLREISRNPILKRGDSEGGATVERGQQGDGRHKTSLAYPSNKKYNAEHLKTLSNLAPPSESSTTTTTDSSSEDDSGKSPNDSVCKLSNKSSNDDDVDSVDGKHEARKDSTFSVESDCNLKEQDFDHTQIDKTDKNNELEDNAQRDGAHMSDMLDDVSYIGGVSGQTSDALKQQNIASAEESTDSPANGATSLVCGEEYEAIEEESITQEDKENTCDQTTSSSSGPENDSNKENTLVYTEPEVFIDYKHLKKPHFEEFEDSLTLKVTSALVVHLTDKISSYQDQKGRAAGNMLLYVARDTQCSADVEPEVFLGIVLFDDMDVRQDRFRLPSCFLDEHLETTLNYILAWYTIRVLARINEHKAPKMNMLVQPPIQRDSAAIMVVASRFGCKKIVSSSNLADLLEDLHLMVPRSVVLSGDLNRSDVIRAVGKDGVDVAIMLRQQELVDMLDIVAPSGCLVLCGDVDRTKEINMRSIPNNGQITLFDALSAVRYLTTMAGEPKRAFQRDLHHLLSVEGSQLEECFPPSREGYFYQVLGRFSPIDKECQPLERFILDMFLSTSRALVSVLDSASTSQWNVLGKIFGAMSRCTGDDCCPGNVTPSC